MKRGLKWSDGEDDDSSSSDDSSAHNSDAEVGKNGGSKTQLSKLKASQVDSAEKKKKKSIDIEALNQHGYKGGLSVLKVPAPKEPEKEPNWSWSTGKDKVQRRGGEAEEEEEEEEETYEERMKTRAALVNGERLLNVQTRRERNNNINNNKNMSFQQKEKRRRELGQTSRGKNYVEEEKRLLRNSGIYSGFDT